MINQLPLPAPGAPEEDASVLNMKLSNVFQTTDFAYLVNASMGSNQEVVYGLALGLPDLPPDEKMKMLQPSLM